MKKRLLAVVAVAAIVVTMMPSMVFGATTHNVSNETELINAIASVDDGGTINLTSDIELTTRLIIDQEKEFTIDGKGFSIKQAANYDTSTYGTSIMIGNSGYADEQVATHSVIFKDVMFDGHVKGEALIRAQGVKLKLDGCTIKNCKQTSRHSLIELDYTEATLINTRIENNEALIGVHHNYQPDDRFPSGTKFTMDNCVVENNTFNGTAAVYYVMGSGSSITKCEFIDNKVNCNNNGAVVYLGDENSASEVTGCLFKDNEVKDSSSSTRVAGAIFFKDDAKITGNAFENNSASNINGSDGLGQSLCMKIYENCTVDLNGNYWGGDAPVEGKDYFLQAGEEFVTFEPITDYYTSYRIGTDGNVVLGATQEEEPTPDDPAEDPTDDAVNTDKDADKEESLASGDVAETEASDEPESSDVNELTEEPEEATDTGDDMNVVLPIVLAAAALAAMATVVATRRRHN